MRPGSARTYENPIAPVDGVHPVLHEGKVAVITGAGSGIGRAAAIELARIGMKIAIADVNEPGLQETAQEVAAIIGQGNVLAVPTDVSKFESVVAFREKVYEAFGEVAVLMNNAGIGLRGTSWEGLENWQKIFEVNVFGIVNVQHAFLPTMLPQENAAMIINTGSKQGITNPPGNAAYNASKAAVKSLTEGLSHELRNSGQGNITAHLFVPGWTHTGMTKGNLTEKPAGAWTAQETVLYMLDRVREGNFYIIVPDNETRKEVDQLRMLWAAGDVAEGRPALSRWHKDYKALFEEYVRDNLAQLD
ncbi:uncharacterized protein PHACADRAFT_106145 [Phanerochaete carnosa HHB-10118-sp]|uniref:NAD(P)-binding protein n=1 Tax=Phanerochaete carnosa (strain HHB-10118-sp) TaxID=650164 RepID=K5VF45_PHACS|nr:uncharacterized protein PHACADRAFT_106145 [Phanerochaete carnosa HHB-10118-sp]EKM49773.1 hypothetical protein PHACADRAFT_106145 [Phanerochaete carnosa HHB-10118-sp]